jgi:penicillin amidase
MLPNTPPPAYQLKIDGLDEAIDVVYDSWGVPHISAATEHDTWMAMGFFQALDRFFQMDNTRRTIAGTRAELFGEWAVAEDHDMRVLGLAWGADQMLQYLSAEDMAVLDAFADGVNAWREALISGSEGVTLPPEYVDLGIRADELDPWQARDTILILGGFIFALTQSLDIDLGLTAAHLELAPGVVEDSFRLAAADTVPALYPGEYPERLRPSGPLPGDDGDKGSAGTRANRGRDATADALDALQGAGPGTMRDDFAGLGDAIAAAQALWERLLGANPWLITGGSNAWAAAPERCAEDVAIFCSDNHVGTPLPSVYYEMHLDARAADLVTYGLAIPGSPVIANGFNRNVAWGYTVLPVDGTDLFWDRLPLPNKVSFLGRLVDLEVRHERYWARVDGELVERTDLIDDPVSRYVPHHGPILATALFGHRALTYRWVGFEEASFVQPLLQRMRALSTAEAIAASQQIGVFGANMILADTQGEIGYTVTGTFPIRTFRDLFQPFWPRLGGGLWEWRGALGLEDYLSSISPPRGFLATSNNDPAGYGFDNRYTNDPIYYSIANDLGFRARRIHHELLARTPLTTEAMMAIQYDLVNEPARRLLPHLTAAAEARPDLVDESAAEAIAALNAWDLRATVDSYEESIFHEWWLETAHGLFDDEFDPLFFNEHPALNSMLHLLEHPDDTETGERLWDDRNTLDQVESREEILLAALDRALATLSTSFGSDDITSWLWGDIHRKRLYHPLGGDYNYPPDSEDARPYNAGEHTVCPMESGFRLVAEMRPEGIRAWNVLPGGNSGRRDSPHYVDQAEMYFEGDYRPVLLTPAEIGADAETVWHLRPLSAPADSPQ